MIIYTSHQIHLRPLPEQFYKLKRLPYLCRQRLRIIFPVRLVKVRHRVMDMHHLPLSAVIEGIYDGKSRVHLNERFRLGVSAFPHPDPPVHDPDIVTYHHRIVPFIQHFKRYLSGLRLISGKILYRLLGCIEYLMSARTDHTQLLIPCLHDLPEIFLCRLQHVIVPQLSRYLT